MHITGKIIICPGCGWIGFKKDLKRVADSDCFACPKCGYENNGDDGKGRLLTLAEMFKSENEYNDVRMDLFLLSLYRIFRDYGMLK